MKAKLEAITQPVNPELNVEQFLAYVARVSNPSNQNNHLTAPKLLKYLVKHKHWSPFEMVNLVIELEVPRDIGRQILRHRSFSFQEFSQRYADPSKSMGFIRREARLQDTQNRQNSVELDPDNQEHMFISQTWTELQDKLSNQAEMAYKWAIDHGIAKEQARTILPEGLTMSRMYMNGTLRSWMHYCLTRMKPDTQKEHREVAEACWKIILQEFPSLNNIVIENE